MKIKPDTNTSDSASSSKLAIIMRRDDVQKYLSSNSSVSPHKLLLKGSPFDDVSAKVLVSQIIGRRVAEKKFPFLRDHKDIIYPIKLSLEQASSELTARYKAKLMSGRTMVDLTGGMGIDCYILGQQFEEVDYVEPNSALFDVTKHNYHVLGYDHCRLYHRDCSAYLDSVNEKHCDWAYIDPSRRSDGDRKIRITNYEPNIVALQDQIRSIAENTMIKLSPMQDITECIKALRTVAAVWIISHKNEVKELLVQMSQKESSNPSVTVVDLAGSTETSYTADYQETKSSIGVGPCKKYLYQPAAALTKSGLSDAYAGDRDLIKLHRNTSFYTSDQLVEDYFGRIFEVRAQVTANRKEVNKYLEGRKANVITKNFPLSPSQLFKKLKLTDGGAQYIIGITDARDMKVVLVCRRLR